MADKLGKKGGKKTIDAEEARANHRMDIMDAFPDGGKDSTDAVAVRKKEKQDPIVSAVESRVHHARQCKLLPQS